MHLKFMEQYHRSIFVSKSVNQYFFFSSPNVLALPFLAHPAPMKHERASDLFLPRAASGPGCHAFLLRSCAPASVISAGTKHQLIRQLLASTISITGYTHDATFPLISYPIKSTKSCIFNTLFLFLKRTFENVHFSAMSSTSIYLRHSTRTTYPEIISSFFFKPLLHSETEACRNVKAEEEPALYTRGGGRRRMGGRHLVLELFDLTFTTLQDQKQSYVRLHAYCSAALFSHMLLTRLVPRISWYLSRLCVKLLE